MKRLISVLLAGVISILALGACGADPTATPIPTATPVPMEPWEIEWNEVVAAAQAEGTVSVWVGGGGQAAVDHLKGAFEAAYPGITVDLFQAARSSERDSRYLEEWRAGITNVDLFNGGSSGGDGRLKPAGALQPSKPFWILPDSFDPGNWENGLLFVDIEKQYMLMGGASAAPAVAIADGVDPNSLQTWSDLLKPEFRGQIVMNDPRTSGNGAARAGFWFCAPDPRCFEPVMRDFMEQLFRESGIVLSDDDRANLDSIINGEKLVLISPATDELQLTDEIGATPTLIQKLTLPDGSDLDQISDSAGILFVPNHDLPHPNAATVYINWFYSQEGQQAMIDIRNQPSTRTDVDNSNLPEYVIPFAPAYSVNQTIRMLNIEGGTREKVDEWLPQ